MLSLAIILILYKPTLLIFRYQTMVLLGIGSIAQTNGEGLAEMGLRVVMRAERMLAVKLGKGACPKPAAAKDWKVIVHYEDFFRGLNASYLYSVDLLSITP